MQKEEEEGKKTAVISVHIYVIGYSIHDFVLSYKKWTNT